MIVTDDCGTHIARNDFGRGETVRHGDLCAAPLTVPTPPAILGRTNVPPTTTTTRPPVTPSTRPHPGTTRPRPVPTTVPPPTGSGGGNGLGLWLALAGVVAIAAIVSGLVIQRRAAR